MSPLQRAAQKAYRQTDAYKLAVLQKARAKWCRRETIAQNKLAEIRTDIEELAERLAKEKAGAQ